MRSGINIIVVDDNHEFRESIKDLLIRRFKCNVISEATNGNEFLNLSLHHKADVILMDLYMPFMNGIEATKRILYYFGNAKIIALTNLHDEDILQTLIEAGFKGYIFKNSIFEEIEDAIEAILSGNLWFKGLTE